MPPAELPPRELRDSKELRALNHPVRIRLLEELVFGGPATATDLSERLGESPANCSWHLRQLARYGFVEEAKGGTGRKRPWRMVIRPEHLAQGETDQDVGTETAALQRILASREYEALRAHFTTVHTEAAPWREAAYVTQNVGWCTAEELAELGSQMSALMDQFVHRINAPETRPGNARPVRLFAWGIPGRPLPARPGPGTTGQPQEIQP